MQRMLEWQTRPVDRDTPTFAKYGGKKEAHQDHSPQINNEFGKKVSKL